MRAQATSPFVLRGRVINAGETVEMTESEFDSVAAHVLRVAAPTPAKVAQAPRPVVAPVKPVVEKKVVEKKAPSKPIEKKTVKKVAKRK